MFMFSCSGVRYQTSSANLKDNLDDYKVPRRLDPSAAANMMDIGIRQIFNEDHDIFRATCRKFFKEEVVPNQEK